MRVQTAALDTLCLKPQVPFKDALLLLTVATIILVAPKCTLACARDERAFDRQIELVEPVVRGGLIALLGIVREEFNRTAANFVNFA